MMMSSLPMVSSRRDDASTTTSSALNNRRRNTKTNLKKKTNKTTTITRCQTSQTASFTPKGAKISGVGKALPKKMHHQRRPRQVGGNQRRVDTHKNRNWEKTRDFWR